MIYIFLGIFITTCFQVVFAKKGFLFLGVSMPLIFSVYHAKTEAIDYNMKLIYISFGIFIYYMIVYFLSYKYFKKKWTVDKEGCE